MPFVRNVFTLNTCAHIVGSQVLSFEAESEMLQRWRDFVEEVDPDVVIGYNIAGFDFPYLMDRAKALKLERFPFLGRMRSMLVPFNLINFPDVAPMQNKGLRSKRPTSPPKPTVSVIRRRLICTVVYNSMFCSSCNENISCEVTR